jgi:hypothetical protein
VAATDLVPPEGSAHEMVDEVMPESFEWERLVRDYPVPALVLAGIGGFWLGRTRGRAILTAVAGFAAVQVTEQVNEFLGDEVL